MQTRHMTREVKIWGLYNNDVDGKHFAIVKSGTWKEIVKYLDTMHVYTGGRCLFMENSAGKLIPLMA